MGIQISFLRSFEVFFESVDYPINMPAGEVGQILEECLFYLDHRFFGASQT